MKSLTKKPLIALSAILTAPAIVLCTVGILYLGFRWERLNDLFGVVARTGIGRILFSPWIVLGGATLCLLLNVCQVCRLRCQEDDERFVVSLTVARGLGHLAFSVVALTLIGLVLWYAFVENFQIVAR